MKNPKLQNIFLSEAGKLLIKIKEFKNGQVYYNEITSDRIEIVQGNVKDEQNPNLMRQIGKGIDVYAVIDKNKEILTNQTSFYFYKNYAVSATKQMNRSVVEKNKPYKVEKMCLIIFKK